MLLHYQLLHEIFKSALKDTDLSALGNAIDVVLRIAVGVAGVAPVFQLFRTQINKRLGRAVNYVAHSELEPYLKKLRGVLQNPLGEMVIASET